MIFGRILTSQSAARLAQARHISSFELAAVGDHDRLGGRARARADGLDLLDDVHALGHGAEDDVLAVEPVGLDRAEEEPACRTVDAALLDDSLQEDWNLTRFRCANRSIHASGGVRTHASGEIGA